MKFEERHSFDAPAATLMKMYSDPAFFERKYKDLAPVECERVDQQKTDTRLLVKYRLVMKSDAPLPEVAKKIMGDTIRMTQQDTWDLTKRTGRLDIEIKGAPLKIFAEMKVIEENGKAVNVQSWNLTCSIPLVGGKIEAAVAEDIKTKSRKDLAVSREIIKSYV